MKSIVIIVLLLIDIHASEISAMQDACQNKIAEACFHFGLLYERGSGVKQDTNKAKKYYLKACEYGYDKACISFEQIKIED